MYASIRKYSEKKLKECKKDLKGCILHQKNVYAEAQEVIKRSKKKEIEYT
jgi:hypothetical protein